MISAIVLALNLVIATPECGIALDYERVLGPATGVRWLDDRWLVTRWGGPEGRTVTTVDVSDGTMMCKVDEEDIRRDYREDR